MPKYRDAFNAAADELATAREQAFARMLQLRRRLSYEDPEWKALKSAEDVFDMEWSRWRTD